MGRIYATGTGGRCAEREDLPVTDWDPQQYERFADERARPFIDLVALCRPVPGGRVVDLGCGTGALTADLFDALGGPGEVLGIDASPAMLAEAARRATPGGRLRFAEGDIAAFHDPAAWDVVISNAALQWVPDHPAVIARWVGSLCEGGQLAVQVPANADHPVHRAVLEVAAEEPFAGTLPADAVADPVAANVLPPEGYAELLHDLGLARPVVRLQVYGPVLDHSSDVVEWMKGTSLTRIRRALPAELYDAFLARYRERVLAVVGDRARYYFTFKRILFWAQLPA